MSTTKFVKSKQKPKVKTILANPYKVVCPTLLEEDFNCFRKLLSNLIQKSQKKALEYATETHIKVGLESSLRAINNKQCSCVFISHSIKPRYLISLIARNVELHSDTAPVFVQTNLEEFILDLFGIKALALILPNDINKVCVDLGNWISVHERIKKVKATETTAAIQKKKVKPINFRNVDIKAEEFIPQVNNAPVPMEVQQTPNAWNGDFISLSNPKANFKFDKLDLDEDKDNLASALSKIAHITKTIATDVDTKGADGGSTLNKCEANVTESNSSEIESETDNFLSKYQPLTVHKIKPNPKRLNKKKRKKNKNFKK